MRSFVVALLVAALCGGASCGPEPHQITTTSWHGLSGLYVIPTARMIGSRNLCTGFNESKHSETVDGERYTDRQIRGVVTYGVNDYIEITGCYYNDVYIIPPGVRPQLRNRRFASFGAKVLLLKEDPQGRRPAVALGVRDLFDKTADTGPLKNVGNGTKFHLLASKRILKREETGRFMDVHAGITLDRQQLAGLVGVELALAPSMSLIAEGIWDAPYLNFGRFGENDVPGRYLFNTGLRFYPDLVPGLALDLGVVGDGEFEFSFGLSYVTHL